MKISEELKNFLDIPEIQRRMEHNDIEYVLKNYSIYNNSDLENFKYILKQAGIYVPAYLDLPNEVAREINNNGEIRNAYGVNIIGYDEIVFRYITYLKGDKEKILKAILKLISNFNIKYTLLNFEFLGDVNKFRILIHWD